MIGDNPSADIQGATKMGWKSILVKTGAFQPKNSKNDTQFPANFVVQDFPEAIDLILEQEQVV
jgi:ribonucleotide monophosphatase NagD (HAD superfamily)